MSLKPQSTRRPNRADLGSNNFDFLRFLMASAVILSHSYSLLKEDSHEPLYRATGGFLLLGSVAVFGFFVISGFLVAASWERSKNLGIYLEKRVLRIYPGFLVAILLGYFVVGTIGGIPRRALLTAPELQPQIPTAIFFEVQVNDLAFRTVPYPQAINGSVWTIKYEFLCYLLLPILGVLGLARHKRLAPALFFLMLMAYVVVKTERIDVEWQAPYLLLPFGRPITFIQHTTYFAAGITAYKYRESIVYKFPRALLAIAALIASAFYPATLCVVVPLAFSYLILFLAFERRLKLGGFGRFGDFSYGIYLYAFPIQQLLLLWLGTKFNPWTLFVAAWPLSVAAGVLSWHLVERPFLLLKRRSSIHAVVNQ